MKFDLEERLIRFGVSVLELSEKIRDTKASNHLCSQLIRSATAAPLMYGEVNAAESPADFIHKMGLGLKELREKRNCLRMIQLKKICRRYRPNRKSSRRKSATNLNFWRKHQHCQTAPRKQKDQLKPLVIGYWFIGYWVFPQKEHPMPQC
jgi:four helix bundle protein